jgi:hypothetical protein
MFEEAALGGRRKLAPEPLRVRPDAIDDTAPVAAFGDMRLDTATKPVQLLADADAERNLRFFGAHRVCTTMGFCQQAASRHGNDRPRCPSPRSDKT